MNHNLILKYHVYSFADKSKLNKKEKKFEEKPDIDRSNDLDRFAGRFSI